MDRRLVWCTVDDQHTAIHHVDALQDDYTAEYCTTAVLFLLFVRLNIDLQVPGILRNDTNVPAQTNISIYDCKPHP